MSSSGFTGYYQIFGRQVSRCHNKIKSRSIWGRFAWKGKSNHSRWKKRSAARFVGNSSTKYNLAAVGRCSAIHRQKVAVFEALLPTANQLSVNWFFFLIFFFVPTELIFFLLWIDVTKFTESQPWWLFFFLVMPKSFRLNLIATFA